METTDDVLKAAKGSVQDAIENVYSAFKTTKGRSSKAALRAVYEDLVRMDTKQVGWRRYIRL